MTPSADARTTRGASGGRLTGGHTVRLGLRERFLRATERHTRDAAVPGRRLCQLCFAATAVMEHVEAGPNPSGASRVRSGGPM
jgi:hypothetical protein